MYFELIYWCAREIILNLTPILVKNLKINFGIRPIPHNVLFIMFLYKTHIKIKFLVKAYERKIICKGLKNQSLFWLMKTQKRSWFRFLRITAPENVLFRVL